MSISKGKRCLWFTRSTSSKKKNHLSKQFRKGKRSRRIVVFTDQGFAIHRGHNKKFYPWYTRYNGYFHLISSFSFLFPYIFLYIPQRRFAVATCKHLIDMLCKEFQSCLFFSLFVDFLFIYAHFIHNIGTSWTLFIYFWNFVNSRVLFT